MKEKSLKIIILLMTLSVIGLIVIQFYWINKALKLEEEKFNKNVGLALSEVVKTLEKKEAAKILVKEISSSSKNIVMLNNNIFPPNKTNNINQKRILKTYVQNNDTSKDFNFEIFVDNDSADTNVKVISNVNIVGDTGVEKTLVWHSEFDSLITHKTRIIENVFEELILTGKEDNLIERINRESLDSILTEKFSKYGINIEYIFALGEEEHDSSKIVTEEGNKNIFSTIHKARLFPYDVFGKPNYLFVDFNNKEIFLFSSIWWVLAVSLLFTGLIIFLFYQTVNMLLKQKKITELKNDLLNNITHEFKTPISTISLAADVLGTNGAGNTKKYSEIIKSESKRLTTMVEDILSAAALENSSLELNKERTDIHKIIDDVIEKFHLTINQKEGIINRKMEAKDSSLNIDKQQIFNTVSNIIDNAIKYNADKPEITIETMDSSNAIEIIVFDNGIGIDEKNRDKIFDTFYRVPTGNLHNVKGNGIGLSYVKRIVEAHGGSVKVESEVNKGSKFIINLPKY